VLVVPDTVFCTDTYWCALFSIEHHILKVGGRSRKISRLLENWFKKAVNQLIAGIMISLYIAMGVHEETKWIIFVMDSTDQFRYQKKAPSSSSSIQNLNAATLRLPHEHQVSSFGRKSVTSCCSCLLHMGLRREHCSLR
jgi:hypothetical protein